MKKTKEVKVVDLFCGVGGLTCGLKKAGLNVVAGFDSDETCKYAYEYNNKAKFECADISNLDSKEILKYYNKNDIKILVGCAPCQTFSKQTNKYKNRVNDKKWTLLNYFTEHINSIEPDIISMENVPELTKFDIFDNFKKNLEEKGYNVSYKIVNCSEYGLPQKRKRLVLLASKLGKIELIKPNPRKKKRTVEDVLKGLPYLEAGQVDKNDPLHRCPKLSDINIKRIKQSKPGGTWHDWDKSLLPECYKKPTGATYSSVYGRMSWKAPSPTMTTQFYIYGTGRYGHPEQNRALSLREGAILQTFPRNYRFVKKGETITYKILGRQIGNAVPVDLGKIIGESIKKHLKEYGID